MRGLLIVLAVALMAIPNCCHAQAPAGAEATPPEDGGKYHVSLFLSDSPSPWEQQLAAWFAPGGHPRLSEIAAKSHFHKFTPSHKGYQTRLAKFIAAHEFPAVWIQRADGAVIYKAAGDNLPSSAAAMAEEIDYYGTLQPYSYSAGIASVPDSADHFGRLRPRAQSTDSFCPDGQCGPLDRFRPDGRATPIRDTVELFPRPLKEIGDTVPWIVGGVVVVGLGFGFLCLMAIGVLVARRAP